MRDTRARGVERVADGRTRAAFLALTGLDDLPAPQAADRPEPYDA
ncbi:hypothetical protein ACYCCF_28580 [Streptomyces argenteolus]